MAYLVRRSSGAVQVRECVREGGRPRSRTLASFHGPLTDAVLDEAERRAARPLDRGALRERARALGIGWESTPGRAARRLAAALRAGRTLPPALAAILRESLDAGRAPGLDDDLREAAEWVGTDDRERGTTLRGLLRLGDAIARGRTTTPVRSDPPYPRIRSVGPADRSGPRSSSAVGGAGEGGH
jgi:hypothetical protein